MDAFIVGPPKPDELVNSTPNLKWIHSDVIPNGDIYSANNRNHLILIGVLSLFSDSPLISKVSGKSDFFRKIYDVCWDRRHVEEIVISLVNAYQTNDWPIWFTPTDVEARYSATKQIDGSDTGSYMSIHTAYWSAWINGAKTMAEPMSTGGKGIIVLYISRNDKHSVENCGLFYKGN